MREILFRGKLTDTGNWVYGDLRRIGENAYILDYDIGDDGVSQEHRIFDIAYPVDLATIGQFTGITDKHGKGIWEGDIYHQGDKEIKYVVVWHDASLIGKQAGISSYAGLSYWQDRIEVIGNIHEQEAPDER